MKAQFTAEAQRTRRTPILRLVLCVLCASAVNPLLSQPQEAQAGGLAYLYSLPRAGTEPQPLLVMLPGEDAKACWSQWQPEVAARGWGLVVPSGIAPTDAAVKAIEGIVADFRKRAQTDPVRTYLAGERGGAVSVFYIAARMPDLWAAALAIGGSPRPAIESNRLFGGNTQLVPVLWIPAGEDALKGKLLAAGYNLDRTAQVKTPKEALDWLAGHHSDPFPLKVDCETGNAEFGRCYWAEMTKLDPSRRNDVLLSTRVPPGSGASLALGGFGFDPRLPGPGLVVGWLPENYKGPLKLGDGIVSVGGKPVADASQYIEMMDREMEERGLGVIVQRGRELTRIETRIVLPKRVETQTARLQAEFLSDSRELLIITRGVAELRLNLPPFWVPCPINWNGNDLGKADSAGCWTATEGGKLQRCP